MVNIFFIRSSTELNCTYFIPHALLWLHCTLVIICCTHAKALSSCILAIYMCVAVLHTSLCIIEAPYVRSSVAVPSLHACSCVYRHVPHVYVGKVLWWDVNGCTVRYVCTTFRVYMPSLAGYLPVIILIFRGFPVNTYSVFAKCYVQ